MKLGFVKIFITQLNEHLRISTVRLALFNSLLFVLGIWITIALVYWQVTVFMEQRVDHIIEVHSSSFNKLDHNGVRKAVEDSMKRDLRKIDLYGVFTPDGEKIIGNLSSLPLNIKDDGIIREFFIRGPSESYKNSLGDSDTKNIYLARAKALRAEAGEILVIGRDISEFVEIRRILLNGLITGSAIVLLFGLLIGYALGIRPLKRIKQIQLLSEQIMLGSFSLRMPVTKRRDELDLLAGTVNLMLSEIEKLVIEIRGVTATIAHDLRTPLTKVRLLLSKGMLLYNAEKEKDISAQTQELFKKSILETDHLLERFTAILRIAEIESSIRKKGFQLISLADTLTQVFEMFEPLAEEKGIALKLNISPCSNIFADPMLMLEAISNLVDNAIKFSPPHKIKCGVNNLINLPNQIELEPSQNSSGQPSVLILLNCTESIVNIDIIDSGPGLPVDIQIALLADELEGLDSKIVNPLDSIQKLTQARANSLINSPDPIGKHVLDTPSNVGFGLGLGIVKAILRLHGFRLIALECEIGTHLKIKCPTLSNH
jgi:signal transduction histidine kinase